MGDYDVFCDGFWVRVSPWGSHFEFSLSDVHADAEGNINSHTVGKVRMSNELLKTITFIQAREIIGLEKLTNLTYDPPEGALESFSGIDMDQWNAFWEAVESGVR